MNVFCGRHGMSITMLILTLMLMMMLLMVALNIFWTTSNSIFMLRRHLRRHVFCHNFESPNYRNPRVLLQFV